ncbi:MAG: O-antigen ligase family protein [Paludibacter sp.]|nr:O-antigen ligase family protein [Paludibacter sp.]
MNNYVKSAINYINLFSALVLTASTIFTFSIFMRVGLFVFFISYIIEVFLEKKWVGFKLDKKRIYFLIMLIFFLLAPLSILFDDSPIYFKFLFERRLALLGFSIIGLFGLNEKYNIKYFFQTVILISLIAVSYLLFWKVGIYEFVSNPNRAEIFNLARIQYIHGHMMFNFYLNISLIGIWYVFSNYWNKISPFKFALYSSIVLLFIYILFISEGRTGFTEATLLIVSFVFIQIWKKKRKFAIGLVLIIPVILFGLFSHHKRMSQKELQTEPRIFLWQSAMSLIKEKPVFGFGISNAQEEFDIERTKFQTEEFRIWSSDQKHLDSHNQFLQTTLEFGLFGLILLIIIYVFPIFIVERKKLLLTLMIVGLCLYHSIFDMFLTGQFGLIFCILISLLILSKDTTLNAVKMEQIED